MSGKETHQRCVRNCRTIQMPQNPRRTVDIAEATCFAFLRMMQASSPIDSNVAFLAIESRCTLHGSASTDATELEKAIDNGAIVSNIELRLFFLICVHVLRCYLLEEIDVLVCVELRHLHFCRGFRAL